MIRYAFTLLVLLATAFVSGARTWAPDTLGGGFEMSYFDQGTDYSGPVRSTIVRLRSAVPSQKAVLYIHGFNDYFFQSEMATRFSEHGYNFFAVDLRKYGRSLLKGQQRCQVHNFREYFADIDSALTVIRSECRDSVVLMGHSTGGLVAALYMSKHPDAPIDALVLNSPFLDWNLGKLECFVGAASFAGKIFPGIKFKSGSSRAYGESLSALHHGEWTFDTVWKSIDPTTVDLAWVHAVNSAQQYLKKHPYSIKVPILLMYSAKSIDAPVWTPEVNRADAVLDVADIRHYGMLLGRHVTAIKVNGGMHDLVLSAPDVRNPLMTYIFSWLSKLRQ